MTTLPERLLAAASGMDTAGNTITARLLREAATALQPSAGGEVVPDAWLWICNGKPVNAFLYKPGEGDPEHWQPKGYSAKPLYLASPAQADGFVLDAEKLTAWLDEQLHDAESSWIDTLQELWEDGHDVPSSTEYPALWIAERLPGYLAASTPPSAPRAGDTAQDSGQG